MLSNASPMAPCSQSTNQSVYAFAWFASAFSGCTHAPSRSLALCSTSPMPYCCSSHRLRLCAWQVIIGAAATTAQTIAVALGRWALGLAHFLARCGGLSVHSAWKLSRGPQHMAILFQPYSACWGGTCALCAFVKCELMQMLVPRGAAHATSWHRYAL